MCLNKRCDVHLSRYLTDYVWMAGWARSVSYLVFLLKAVVFVFAVRHAVVAEQTFWFAHAKFLIANLFF